MWQPAAACFAWRKEVCPHTPLLLCYTLSPPTLSLVVISKTLILFMRFPGSMRCFRPYFVTNQVSGFIKSQISISKVFLESFPKSRLRICFSFKNSAVQCKKKTQHDELISRRENWSAPARKLYNVLAQPSKFKNGRDLSFSLLSFLMGHL